MRNRLKHLTSLALTGLVIATSVSTAAYAVEDRRTFSLADALMGAVPAGSPGGGVGPMFEDPYDPALARFMGWWNEWYSAKYPSGLGRYFPIPVISALL